MEDPGTGADAKHVTSKSLKQDLMDSELMRLAGGANQSQRVVGSVGLGYSSEAILTTEISEALKTLIVSHSSSSPDLTHFPWFARTVPTDTWQVRHAHMQTRCLLLLDHISAHGSHKTMYKHAALFA